VNRSLIDRHFLLIIAAACFFAAVALLLVVVTADAAPLSDGNCTGYTWATGIVIGVPTGRVTVYVDGATGTRWTLTRSRVGERVLVRGFACWNVLDGFFAVRRAR
jgi:hypothetical protein